MAEAAKAPEKEQSLIDPIYQKFVRGVTRAIGSTDFYEFFMDAVSRAENQFQFSNRKVVKTVDTTWVDNIEDVLDAFQIIISNPRNVIKEEELIVNVANAKRAGAETVRHLAQHSSLVEEFKPDEGEVRPSKLMQRYREDSIGLYENQLVFTTMEYAYHFVKIRHDALFAAMSDEFGAKLKVQSDMNSATEHVHMDMFLHIKQIDSALETDKKNGDTFARISRIYRVLNVFMSSDFAQQMSKQTRIKGTVNKTNVLKKNRNYKQVLSLYEFLKQYTDIGYTIEVVEQNPQINEQFQQDIYRNILFNYLILKGYLQDAEDREIPTKAKGRKRTLKPKFIHQILEELTEDYDLPDVEIRKVLIEELTKEQLMQEEAAERRRLVEEQAKRKKEEEERIRAEKKAEQERLKAERAAERERLRQEKEAEETRKRQERMRREAEDRRLAKRFREELTWFEEHLPDQMAERQNQRQATKLDDFSDAVIMLEEAEARKREEAARLRKRRQEERERQKRAQELEEEQARQAALLEEERIAQEKLQRAHVCLAPVEEELAFFRASMSGRFALRKEYERRLQLQQERHMAELLARRAKRQNQQDGGVRK